MLIAPDTVLVLDYETGFISNPDPGSQEFQIKQNIPNPFSEKTMISIFLPEKNRLEVSAFTLLGRKVASFENLLDAGNHSFVFYPGSEKNFFPYGFSQRLDKNNSHGKPDRPVRKLGLA
jgi:hypothetical protein